MLIGFRPLGTQLCRYTWHCRPKTVPPFHPPEVLALGLDSTTLVVSPSEGHVNDDIVQVFGPVWYPIPARDLLEDWLGLPVRRGAIGRREAGMVVRRGMMVEEGGWGLYLVDLGEDRYLGHLYMFFDSFLCLLNS